MHRHSLIVAVGLACLFGGPAHAASQRDWAQCRGNDPAQLLVSCGVIIADRDETSESRAEAFACRADAHLARGETDAAIADAGAAIKLAPQNITAHVSQALGYFRKGDRDRAIIGFAIAHRLDAAKADAIAATNPTFAQIAALARGAPPAALATDAAANSSPFCPTRETAGNGFALVNTQQLRKQQVNPSGGDIATSEYFVDGERAMTATYYKGLLIVFASFLETYINSYDIDYTRLGVYQVGEETRYHTSSVTFGGKVRQTTVARRISGQEKLALGDCSFNTFVVESKMTYSDGTKTVARSNFSPDLKSSLRLTTTTDGAEPAVVSFDRIEPLSR
jgi:hypothetical protein